MSHSLSCLNQRTHVYPTGVCVSFIPCGDKYKISGVCRARCQEQNSQWNTGNAFFISDARLIALEVGPRVHPFPCAVGGVGSQAVSRASGVGIEAGWDSLCQVMEHLR